MDIRIGQKVVTRTGDMGTIVQVLNHGFTIRVRWTGKTGMDAVTRERIDDVYVEGETQYKNVVEFYNL